METRSYGHFTSRSQAPQHAPGTQAPPEPTPPNVQPSNNGPRPLSDIRELSEPTIMDPIVRRPANLLQAQHSGSRVRGGPSKGSVNRSTSANSESNFVRPTQKVLQATEDASSSYSSTPEQSKFYSIPQSSVPQRSSSHGHGYRPIKNHARKPSIRIVPSSQPQFEGFVVPNHGQSRSPVKEIGQRLDAVNSDAGRRMPSRTLIRTPQPLDILQYPTYRHPRVKLELHVSAPLFVGGGSVEGHVKVTVDENERLQARRSLGIGALSVDLLGFEDMPGSRKATFLAVGTELIDTAHPPPGKMVQPANPLALNDTFWTLVPSTSSIPFLVSLPLDTGPPPFHSKHASVRFLLCVTALIRDAGKHYRVRASQDIHVLATYDPEKALTSLPSPLTASDVLDIRRFGRCESVKVTAGLHRQVWVSGSSIFVDVHVANKTHRPVKRLELSLERNILCYKHAPAATQEKSASQARIFESNEQNMITRSSLKPGDQCWNGIEPYSSQTRTCELELPRGHATVRCGKYFEVRFFLNVTASLSNSKLVSVQLPIILVHINSLDVLPNSVAQVAAAIELKRAQGHRRERSKNYSQAHVRQRSASSPAELAGLRRKPSYVQGRAFAAPRQQSIDQQRAATTDIDNLRQTLDSSPRKHEPRLHGVAIKKMGSNISFGNVSLGAKKGGDRNHSTSMAYRTPPTDRHAGRSKHSGESHVEGFRYQLRRVQSKESVRSKKSAATARSKHGLENATPKYNFTVIQNRIEPHTLGLSGNAGREFGLDGHIELVPRPGTSLSFREKMDRSRFESKGVHRKASGSMKERGMNWWEQVKHREKEREGWI